ncbi:hypothetical protein KAR91_23815 [Candidatus Pacearchaeota archaeon]|nr:hypothetical protein [Candidatus Pacearchaeota archaeon]
MWGYEEDVSQTASTSTSTNIINLGDAYKGVGETLPVLIMMTTALVGATATLTVELFHDSVVAMSGEAVLWTSGAIPVATCVLGYKFKLDAIPHGCLQFTRLKYTVATATTTAGVIFAGIVGDVQENPYA